MMRQPSRKSTILIGQVSILLISLVTAFAPQYYLYFFILYFIIIMAFMFKSTRKMGKLPPQKELGAPLFKENNAMKIAMSDKLLTDELKKQALASMGLLFMTLLVFILFPLYRTFVLPVVHDFLTGTLGDDVIVRFLDFLIMYEVIFGILTGMRIVLMSKTAAMNIMIPQKFVLYRKGLVTNDRFFIELSKDLCYNADTKRHFVELINRKQQGMRIRLYTDSTTELIERIKSLEVEKCGEQNL